MCIKRPEMVEWVWAQIQYESNFMHDEFIANGEWNFCELVINFYWDEYSIWILICTLQLQGGGGGG